jgi:diphthamide biosynthesis protein 4
MPADSCYTEPTYYKILGLSRPTSSTLSKQDVRAAYHRTLLRYHPDKAIASLSTERTIPRQDEESYTVDQITQAYHTLSSPLTRAVYDQQLDSSPRGKKVKWTEETLHNGVEVHDLEDLVYDEDINVWSSGCRCGDSHGYVLTEPELERETSEGEIYVACKGCSLWVKVQFGTMESGREMEEEGTEHQQSGTRNI